MTKLDELKSLLLQPENDRITAIEERLDRSKLRSDEVASVLPAALATSHERGEFAPAMQKPLAQIMNVAIREEPESFADALFPVIGPAIRKAVAESFKTLAQQLNDAIEHSITPRGMGWRFQAWRSGVPYSEYVLQQTRGFDVEQAFLIHGETGLLIAHAQGAIGPQRDKDAISAMFSALQSFVQESFSRGETDNDLETAELGELTVWAVHGPASVLACVIHGLPPRTLRTELREALEEIEGEHGHMLRNFDGNQESGRPIVPLLRQTLISHEVEHKEKTALQTYLPIAIILGLLVLGIGWMLVSTFLTTNRERRVGEALNDVPGLVISSIATENGKVNVRGLIDPMAADPTALVEAAGVEAARLQLDLRPMLSLDPAIVVERARRGLQPPNSVTIESNEGLIRIHGDATRQWIDETKRAVKLSPGLAGALIDVRATDAPDPNAGLLRELNSLHAALNGTSVSYSEGIQPDGQFESILAAAGQKLARFIVIAGETKVDYRLVVSGHTDSTGPAAINEPLRRSRAEEFARRLSQAVTLNGSKTPAFSIKTEPGDSARKAVLVIELGRASR